MLHVFGGARHDIFVLDLKFIWLYFRCTCCYSVCNQNYFKALEAAICNEVKTNDEVRVQGEQSRGRRGGKLASFVVNWKKKLFSMDISYSVFTSFISLGVFVIRLHTA